MIGAPYRTAIPASPVLVDGFEVTLYGLPLKEVRPLTRAELSDIHAYSKGLRLLGLTALFSLLVVVPFAFQIMALIDHAVGDDDFFLPGLFLVLSLFLFYYVPAGLRLRRQVSKLYIFGDSSRQVQFLPEASAIWKIQLSGIEGVNRNFSRQVPLRVAPPPEHRIDGKLTEVETAELTETINARRLYLLAPAATLAPILIGAALLFETPTFYVLSAILLLVTVASLVMHHRFRTSLKRASARVEEDENGNEFLSSGIPWTVKGRPAGWRYNHPNKRLAHFVSMGP